MNIQSINPASRKKTNSDGGEQQKEGGRNLKQVDVLYAVSEKNAEAFHSPDQTAYVDVIVGNHRETWPVRSRTFRHWLTTQYFKEKRTAPSSDSMQRAINLVEAGALIDGPEREVFTRVGGIGGSIYLDLADNEWRAVEVN